MSIWNFLFGELESMISPLPKLEPTPIIYGKHWVHAQDARTRHNAVPEVDYIDIDGLPVYKGAE